MQQPYLQIKYGGLKLERMSFEGDTAFFVFLFEHFFLIHFILSKFSTSLQLIKMFGILSLTSSMFDIQQMLLASHASHIFI